MSIPSKALASNSTTISLLKTASSPHPNACWTLVGLEDSLFEQAANYLNEAIEQYFPDRRNPRIIAEPGRFYVFKAFRLAPNIIARSAPIAGPPAQGPSEPASDQPAVRCAFLVLVLLLVSTLTISLSS